MKRTNFWRQSRSEITTQPKNDNIGYLNDLTCRNTNKLFALSLKNGKDDPTRNYFDKYYMGLVEIRDFNALINNQPFLIS